jgi:hypothetical protein
MDKLITLAAGIGTYREYKLLGEGVVLWRDGIVDIINNEIYFEEMDISVEIMNRLDSIRLYLCAQKITMAELVDKMQTYS